MPKDLAAVLRWKAGTGVMWVDQLGAIAVTQAGKESSLESGVGGNERGVISRTW